MTRPPPAARRRLDLLAIGIALMDHLAFAGHEALSALGLRHGTTTLVDVATTERIAQALAPVRQVSGGSEANVAVGVASLGGRPAFVGAVADDPLGKAYAADLEAAGVRALLQVHPAGADPEAATGRCHVIVTPDAERTMATALGAAARLDRGACPPGLVGTAGCVFLDAYVLDLRDGGVLVERVLEEAAVAGTTVAFGLADPLAVERHRAAVEALVAGPVEVLFANEAEALALTGAPSLEAAAEALRRPGLVAFLTRGASGALVVTAARVVAVPAARAERVVDATGAGDLFAAGALFGLARGADPARAARLGASCAAEVVAHLGGRPETALAQLARRAGLSR
ncbi:MAG TPA: adenosine kinase [Acidimicrobiales bacterium]|nr:adenosine kinase [Acidimicrobiales bacterium]